MGRPAWLRTAAIRDVERKLKEDLVEFLTRSFFDEGKTVAEIHRILLDKGVDMSYRMVYYYIHRIEHDMHRKGSRP